MLRLFPLSQERRRDARRADASLNRHDRESARGCLLRDVRRSERCEERGMRCVAENIGPSAQPLKDRVAPGRFWEGRFKLQILLD